MMHRRDLSERRTALSNKKRALLERRLKRASSGLTHTEIAAAPQSAPLSASFAQERLWFLQQLEPQSAAYNEFAAYRIRGGLDCDLLDRTVTLIINRHNILRTGFSVEAGRPTPILSEAESFHSHRVDLRLLNYQDREVELVRLAKLEAHRPFDLERPPLLRSTVLQLRIDEDVVFLTLHHIIGDGWSTGILLREFNAIYSALTSDTTPKLPHLPIQYSDFAHWQREQTRHSQFTAQLAYWKGQLEGAPPLLAIPTDRPRLKQLGTTGRRHIFPISSSLTEALHSLGRASHATLFMALLAGFDTLLSRYARQTDLMVASPVSSRTHPELEPLIGCFLNLLVLRTDLSDDPAFEELVWRTRRITLDALANQSVPYEQIVMHLRPERNIGSVSLCQVMFALQNFQAATADPPGLHVTPLPINTDTSKFDLSLIVEETPRGLSNIAEYRTELFESATITRMMAHLVTILEEAAKEPSRQVSQLPLLSVAEREEITVGWNDTDVSWRDARPIPRLFEQQVGGIPERIAIRCGESLLSYNELNLRANTLAHRLRQAGVRPNVLVPVCMGRSVDLAIALLGVAKSGGAYIPIDVRTPWLRLEKILRDANLRVLLTDDALANKLPHADWETLTPRDWLFEGETANPSWAIEGSDLAYVIYTSGSTGEPKGVPIKHRGLTNTLLSIGQELGDATKGLMLAVTTVSFDIAALELFMPLIHGGTTEIAEESVCEDGAALSRRLDSCPDLSMVQATPSMWRMLLAAGWRGKPGIEILCGGEWLSSDLADALVARGARVWNLYGPTETTIWSTLQRITRGNGSVSIGRPIANTRAYVLDARLEPIPIGVVGELYLGGEGVARGYLNRPEFTAAQFLPDPFRASGARMYRTGDLARYSSHGALEFCGRVDHEIKIRGFRIEPGDVETTITEHPAVVESVVVADAPNARLLAYVVLVAEGAISRQELRDFVAERLPAYMVPTEIGFLQSLPRNPNGKVDHRALQILSGTLCDSHGSSTGDIIEEVMCSILADVLSLPRVSMQASFFELGGHSLLAAQVVARFREAFGVDLAVHQIVDAFSVAQIGRKISDAIRDRHGITRRLIIPNLSPDTSRRVSVAQERLWLLYRAHPRLPHHILTRALRLHGTLNIDILRASLGTLVTRHPVLRATFHQENGVIVQRLTPSPGFEIVVLDIDEVVETERDPYTNSLVWKFSQFPFDLERGPLLRALVLRLSFDEHIFVLATHHIVCDGWSLVILERDLRVIYGAAIESTVLKLPVLPIQYSDYAEWQRSAGMSEVEHAVAYWRAKLAGAMGDPGFPKVLAGPAARSFLYGIERITLDDETTLRLREASRRAGVSMFMSLFTGLVGTLRRHGCRHDLSIGTLVANRIYPETQDVVGLFVNTIVIRVSVSDEDRLSTLVQRVRTTALEAYAHQEIPFEVISDALCAEGSGALPFEILMIYQNITRDDSKPEALAASDFEVVPPDVPSGGPITIASTFSLIFEIEESRTVHRVSAKYALEVLEAEFVRELLRGFRGVLSALIDEPERRLNDI